MFKPLEMMKVALQILHSDSAKVTHVIAKQGLFHLLDSQKLSPSTIKLGSEDVQETLTRYTMIEQGLKSLFQQLSIGRALRKDLEIEPLREIEVVEDAVKRIQNALSSTANEIGRIEREREEKSSQAMLLQSIVAAAPDLDVLRKFSYFYKRVGFIVTKDIARLEASLTSINLLLVPLITLDRRTLIAALCSSKDKDVLDRALKSAYVEQVELPDFSQGNLQDVIAGLERDVTALAEKKTALSKGLKETQKEIVQELQLLREKVSLALMILKAHAFYAKGSRSYVIQGWVPKDRITEFETEIMRVTEGRARIEISEPEMVEEVRQGKLSIPILFNNPYLIRPFETLVFNYGTQNYKEVDATPFVAISFLLMFGMMFGDIGHGAILFGIGYWLFSKYYQFLDYALIVMECGVSSAIFGLLYGSVFGVEHWIPALWLRPAENIETFMQYAIGLGVFMISAGVILNIINSFKRKDYESGFLGHYGIIGGLFYWTSIGLGLKYAVSGNFGMGVEALIVLLGLPLGVIFFKEPLGHLLFHQHERGEKLFPSGVVMFVMESAIDVMDIVVRYMASTVSFVRTAAFALAHGGLFIAIFSLADILAELKGGGLWYWLAILFGNVLVIALEGLVVSIQTVRLEYYEFFSKFFKGGGERFQPLKIE